MGRMPSADSKDASGRPIFLTDPDNSCPGWPEGFVAAGAVFLLSFLFLAVFALIIRKK
jgi:hypothetical protein